MKKNIYIISLAASLLLAPGAQAKLLYGVTSTTMDEGNGRVVYVDTDNLSDNPAAPTALTDLSTFEHANDFMAGTSMGDVYYCYYNTYDGETGVSMQYFGTLNFESGDFTQIAEANHVLSDDVTDVIDMVYDKANGGLLALDRQYVPSQNTFVSTIQKINTVRGTLQEIICLDKKYSGICTDGADGFYLVSLDRESGDIYHPTFYKATKRFEITPIESNASSLNGESSFAHSLALDEGKLYFANGSIITILDLESGQAVNKYLDRQIYGITFEKGTRGPWGGVETIASEAPAQTVRWFDLQGHQLNAPSAPGIYIRVEGTKATKVKI